VQEQILERYPEADVRVYAVWLPVLPTDERFEVADLMVDARVSHYWDGDRRVSDAFGEAAGLPEGALLWDAFLLFAPAATWTGSPPEPLARGAPVVDEVAKMQQALQPYVD
jgi:hypothetical protein